MSWLSEVVRPKLRELVGGQREIPDNLWRKCPGCGQLVFHRDLEKNLQVCPHCGHHLRLGVTERLRMLFDGGFYQLIDIPKAPVDPLRFRDVRRYTDRLKEAQARTGHSEALVVALGTISGVSSVLCCMNFEFLGGSMGIGVGDGIIAGARAAVSEAIPFIVIAASGGARMQEGVLSLMQMARTTIAVSEVREKGLPIIVVLTDPTTGGVSASFAMLGDITIAEPGAVIGFAGARVIEQTIRESLPEGFQKAEYLLEHGIVDMVVPRPQLRETLGRILGLVVRRGPAATASMTVDAERPEDAAATDQHLHP